MEMKEGTDTNEAHLLGIGRQAYGPNSEGHPSGSNQVASNHNGSSASGKKNRMADGECWFRESDTWRTPSLSELPQEQAAEGSHRAKRQNCFETTSCNLSNFESQGSGTSRTNMPAGANVGHGWQTGAYGYCEPACSGQVNTGSEFTQDPSDVLGNRGSSNGVPSWAARSGARELVSPGAESWDVAKGSLCSAGTSMIRLCDGSLPDGACSGGSRISSATLSTDNSKGKGCLVDHPGRELQVSYTAGGNHSSSSVAGSHHARQAPENKQGLESSLFAYSSPLFEADGAEGAIRIGSLACDSVDYLETSRSDHVHGGRSSCKRRMSAPGLSSETSAFRASESSRRRESIPTRIGGTGPIRPDLNASNPNLNGTGNSSLVQAGDDSGNDRSGFVGNDNDFFESFRTSTAGESFQRAHQSHTYNALQEQSPSQLHSLFARNLRRSAPAAHAPLISRRASEQLSSELDGNGTESGSFDDFDHWSMAFGDRGSNPSVFSSWGGNSSYRRGNIVFPSPVRESSSSLIDGSRFRSLSGRAPSWAGASAENRSGQAATVRGIPGSFERVLNSPDGSGQASANPSTVFHSSGPSSHLSASIPNSRSSAGGSRTMPPPSASTGHLTTFGSPPEVVPSSVGTRAGSAAPHLPLFLERQGESVMAAPVQSIFGIPFRGLHMLPADGEHRQRFLSEILSALEHAWRSEELSYEELVMLDPALVYGGFDAHDRHSDLRLDVDNMSYEELLALEERIGNVSTGLSGETISLCLRESKFSSLDATVAAISQESDIKCSICQEEFVEDDELGRLDCGHGYHTLCIKQWLALKNLCPICKAPAYSKT